MFEGLEPADDAAELAAHFEVLDGGLQAPAGHADLFGGEQTRSALECAANREGAVGENEAAGCSVEADVGELAGHVEGADRRHRRTGSRDLVQRSPGGNEEDVGLECAGDARDGAGRPTRPERRRGTRAVHGGTRHMVATITTGHPWGAVEGPAPL